MKLFYRHVFGGNCWVNCLDYEFCNEHDSIRGECEFCPPCEACEDAEIPSEDDDDGGYY